MWVEGESNVTREMIQALKLATDINVFLKAGEPSILRCIRKRRGASRFPFRKAEFMLAEVTRSVPSPYQSSSWVLMSTRGVWRALALALRVGDRLDLRCVNNDNWYMEQSSIPAGSVGNSYYAGYTRVYHDELIAFVFRPRQVGSQISWPVYLDRFVLGCSVCPDSSARALQRY